jgi:ketosteroid isomerase-like protein
MSSSVTGATREARLDALADRLFTALRERDYDDAAALFAPDATWWMNSGLRGPVGDILPRLKAQGAGVGDHTHEEVRRLFGPDGFVEQHVARWRAAGGEPRELAVCAVVRVGPDGLVTRFEEYYDTAALESATGPSTLTTIQRVAEHVQSEYGNRVAEIVPTISDWDVHYALLSRTRRGLVLEEVHDKPGAEVYYAGTRDAYNVVTSYHLKEVNTSWYSFHESMGQVTHVGVMDGVAPTGKNLFVPSAVLFPVWPDGIIGEIVWTRFDMAEIARGNTRLSPPPPAQESYLPSAQMRNARAHEEFVLAWREGDVGAMVGLLDDECCSCVRTAEVAGERRTRTVARTRDEHRRYLASPEAFRPRSLRVTNLVVGDWYVFAEYLLELDREDGRVSRELAVLYPVTEDGRLIGQLGYALDRRG